MGFVLEIFLLGLDSFIASIAIAPVLKRKLWIPFALAFAICDGLGSLAGLAFHVNAPDALEDTLETAFPIALGIYWLAIALLGAKMQRSDRVHQSRLAMWPIWLVPIALAVDNITYHLAGHQTLGAAATQAFGLDAWTSGLLSLIGILVGVAAARLIPAMKKPSYSFGVAGSALIVGGALIFALD